MEAMPLNDTTLLVQLYKNITKTLADINTPTKEYSDNRNAYLYILFVLMFYAFSIVILMIKYIKREREGSKMENYFNEFVRRDWYRDKSLYDTMGRRIRDESKRQNSKKDKEQEPVDSDDDIYLERSRSSIRKPSILKRKKKVCLRTPSECGATSQLLANLSTGLGGTMGLRPILVKGGATPSPILVKGGASPTPRPTLCRQRASDYHLFLHRASLDEALELQNIRVPHSFDDDDEEVELDWVRSATRLAKVDETIGEISVVENISSDTDEVSADRNSDAGDNNDKDSHCTTNETNETNYQNKKEGNDISEFDIV